MEKNTLQRYFDDLRQQFKNMDDDDLSKEDRLNVFRQAQQTLKSIDHAVSYAKGTDSVNFGFSSVLHMSTLPPLENEQRSAYQAGMNSFFEDIFQNLDEETILNIFKGKFEAREKQAGKAGLPQLSENQDHELSDHEAEVYKVSDSEIQRQIDKVRKIFPRMDSDAQAEAESSYKQCFATMKKANKMASEGGIVSDFSIGFSKILEESHFESRLFADIKGIDVSGLPTNASTMDVSSSRELRVFSSTGVRSLAEIAVGSKVVTPAGDKGGQEKGSASSLVTGHFDNAVRVKETEVSVKGRGGLCASFNSAARNPRTSCNNFLNLDM